MLCAYPWLPEWYADRIGKILDSSGIAYSSWDDDPTHFKSNELVSFGTGLEKLIIFEDRER